MGRSLTEIAEQLKASDKKVQLIYAFNGTGKTRLSREFKHLIVPETDRDENAGHCTIFLYYNAFTEDLFYWDNDLENDAEPKLKIQPNSFTKWILTIQGKGKRVIEIFQHHTNTTVTPKFSEDFSEVMFSLPHSGGSFENIKISKGEESNFIWSVFYSLIEQVIEELNILEPENRSTSDFNDLKYIFIDDPVSSLDENHLIELAVNLASLIKRSTSDVKFIISTHNPLFYNVIYNEVKAKSGHLLKRLEDGTFEIEEKKGDSNHSFSYHLFLKRTLEQAIAQNNIQRYHFTFLRNLYEKTASFLGYPQWSDLLPDEKQLYHQRIINFTSHSTLSNETIAEPTGPEKQTVSLLLNHLTTNYKFWQQVEENV